MNKNPKKERKNRTLRSIVIEPFKQFKFGVYVISISVAFILIASYLFVSSFAEQYNHVMELFDIVDPELRRDFILDDVFYSNGMRLAVFFALFLLTMFYTIFRLTHRYYGPLVSIHRFLDQIEKGNYAARVSIRNKDELQDLVKRLNVIAEQLEKRHPR